MAPGKAFPDWAPTVEHVGMPGATCHLAEESLPLFHASSSTRAPLRRFAALRVPCAAVSERKVDVAGVVSDVACCVGAPVWALDWCPQQEGRDPGRDTRFLAVGTHASGSARQLLGVASSGANAVQLWRVPPPRRAGPPPDSARAPPRAAKKQRGASKAVGPPREEDVEERADADEDSLPTLALLLSHAHGCVWDLKWRPSGALVAPHAGLGLLAVACGDGTVCVVSVPDPDAAPLQASSGGGATALKLVAAWRGCAGPALAPGTQAGLPWTLAWHPGQPGSRLLAGCTDGRCVIYDLHGLASSAPQPGARQAAPPRPEPCQPLLQLLSPSPLALRCVCWAPPALGEPGATLAAACGDEGALSVWDVRSPAAPLWRTRAASSFLLSLAWQAQPRALVATSDSGRLLLQSLALGHAAGAAARKQGAKPGACVSASASPLGTACWGMDATGDTEGVLAYCGADGQLVVGSRVDFSAMKHGKSRSRVVASLAVTVQQPSDDQAPSLRLNGAAGAEALSCDTSSDVALAVKLQAAQALHRCRWGDRCQLPGGKTERCLAAAGAAGVMRILKLRLQHDRADDSHEVEEEED